MLCRYAVITAPFLVLFTQVLGIGEAFQRRSRHCYLEVLAMRMR